MALSYDTLGALLDDGYRIWLHCDAPVRADGTSCHYNRQIDLAKLTAHLGREHSSSDAALLPHLFCPKCGSKKVDVRLHAPNDWAKNR